MRKSIEEENTAPHWDGKQCIYELSNGTLSEYVRMWCRWLKINLVVQGLSSVSAFSHMFEDVWFNYKQGHTTDNRWGLEVRNFAREGNLWAFYSITTYDTTATASIKRKFEIEFAVCFTPSFLFLNIDFQYAPGDNIFPKASIMADF